MAVANEKVSTVFFGSFVGWLVVNAWILVKFFFLRFYGTRSYFKLILVGFSYISIKYYFYSFQ